MLMKFYLSCQQHLGLILSRLSIALQKNFNGMSIVEYLKHIRLFPVENKYMEMEFSRVSRSTGSKVIKSAAGIHN